MTITSHGRHRVQLGDVNDGLDNLMQGDRAAVMYSDPPWGQGNIKYWTTINKRHTGRVVEPAPLEVFLSSVFDAAAKYATDWLLVDYGIKWTPMIEARGTAAGFELHDVIEVQYKSGAKIYPENFFVFGRPGVGHLPAGYRESVYHTTGYPMMKRCIAPVAKVVKEKYGGSPILLDPCCGMGYAAQAAVDFGLTFRGNELNEKRLGKTIARLEKDAKKNPGA